MIEQQYNELKALFNPNNNIQYLCDWLKSNIDEKQGFIRLIITPSSHVSKKVFKDILLKEQSFDFEIARHVRDGNGYEFILSNSERVVIQDISYLLSHTRDGIKFKSIDFVE